MRFGPCVILVLAGALSACFTDGEDGSGEFGVPAKVVTAGTVHDPDEGPTIPLGDPANCYPGSFFQMDLGQSHRRASATYAAEAVRTRAWPSSADMSQLELGDFVAAYADPGAPDVLRAEVARGATDSSTGQLFVVPAASGSASKTLELFVVVDTTTSMRNELPLAGRVVREIAESLDALDSEIDISFGVVALGSTSERFAILQEGNPSDIAQAFEAFLNAPDGESGGIAFKDGQLGPFVGLDALDQVGSGKAFSERISTADAPHVFVLTDGGFAADEGTVRTLDAWTTAGAYVSFAQLYAPSEGSAPMPTSFRGDLLTSLASRGGGASLFLTDEALSDPTGLFSVGALTRDLVGRAAVPFEVASDEAQEIIVETAQGEDALGGPHSRRTTWVPSAGAVASLPVRTCGAPPRIAVDGEELATDPSAHLTMVVGVVDVLRRGCEAQTDFAALKSALPEVDVPLQTLLDEMTLALEACPAP